MTDAQIAALSVDTVRGVIAALAAARQEAETRKAALYEAQRVADGWLLKSQGEVERLRAAQEALRPFAKFAEAFDAKPIGSLDDTFYAIHTGSAWAAELRVSDCRTARAALAASPPRSHPVERDDAGATSDTP